MKSGTQKLGSVSDLMSGLMMVFLFIAIAYMVQTEDDKIELIAGVIISNNAMLLVTYFFQ